MLLVLSGESMPRRVVCYCKSCAGEEEVAVSTRKEHIGAHGFADNAPQYEVWRYNHFRKAAAAAQPEFHVPDHDICTHLTLIYRTTAQQTNQGPIMLT